MRKLALLLIVCGGLAHAIEITTGKMLGPKYDQRSFYVREHGAAWQKTYAGKRFRSEAAGKLMNLRLAQALFHDEYLTEAPFDPLAHTKRVIAALDTYKRNGILAINVSMQGGNMQYDRDGSIKRDRTAKLGSGKGALVSAFRPDGSLKPEWLDRLLLLQRALNERGMILNLLYFYAHQDEVLEGPRAIDRGVRELTDWLIDHNCRNVMIEIANEYDAAAFDYERYIFHQMGSLIELARERFRAKKAAFQLPISASTIGGKDMQVYPSVLEHADLTTIHGNHRTPEEKRRRVAELLADPKVPGPIYMDEDDNGRDTRPEVLATELASCDAVFHAGGSWGYMPWVQTQVWPFRIFDPTGSDRDSQYFREVLAHIRKLVLAE
jgi:hypothetical protein